MREKRQRLLPIPVDEWRRSGRRLFTFVIPEQVRLNFARSTTFFGALLIKSINAGPTSALLLGPALLLGRIRYVHVYFTVTAIPIPSSAG